jgi:hypothetical protein
VTESAKTVYDIRTFQNTCLLIAALLFVLPFDSEDGGDTFLRNVDGLTLIQSDTPEARTPAMRTSSPTKMDLIILTYFIKMHRSYTPPPKKKKQYGILKATTMCC